MTGGFAADILTCHFPGEQFAQDWSSDLAKRLKWLSSEHGSVTVLRKFSPLVAFNLESPNLQPVAHPLLVYTELMFQGRERELKQQGFSTPGTCRWSFTKMGPKALQSLRSVLMREALPLELVGGVEHQQFGRFYRI